MNKTRKGNLTKRDAMVPVLDIDNIPLMPCSEKRARLLLQKGEAKVKWQSGFFAIQLLKEPSARKYQEVAIGIDPGSKREGYTVLTPTATIINVTSDTPNWVKKHLETRRILRRSRRTRNAPYRKMRDNRSRKLGWLPPSTKSRWDAKLRVTKTLLKILPITAVNVEDIQATTKPGKSGWNTSFSPLETGKTYFYNEMQKLIPALTLTQGYQTKEHRDKRSFKKSGKKLDYTWNAHNVDSHCLAEMALKAEVIPFLGLQQLNFLEYYRRQTHIQNPIKGGYRKPYGTTLSLGFVRGSQVRYSGKNKNWKGKIFYVGGNMNGRISLHNPKDKSRITQSAKEEDLSLLHISKWTLNYITNNKKGAISPLP